MFVFEIYFLENFLLVCQPFTGFFQIVGFTYSSDQNILGNSFFSNFISGNCSHINMPNMVGHLTWLGLVT